MIVLEKLARLEHEQWSHWMRHLGTKVEWKEGIGWVIPAEVIIEWQRKINTTYEDLLEAEKDSDREWAKKVIAIYQQAWDDHCLSPYERAKPDED